MNVGEIIRDMELCGATPSGIGRPVSGIVFDSRRVTEGCMFVAVRGTASDGHGYIAQAIDGGATSVVCERIPEDCAQRDDVCWIVTPDSSKALAQAASAFYGNPSSKLRLVGVTGTNGKTTVATQLYNLFEKLGYKCGLISTVVYRIHDREIPSTHTTPDQVRLNAMLAEMADAGCEYCFMEVSSHSIVQKRAWGLRFEGALFTNITHDHLDYHGTFAEYIKAKKGLFDSLGKESFAIVNADDRNGNVMLQNTRARHLTYSLHGTGDFNARLMEMTLDGMLAEFDSTQLWIRLLGRFNVYNMLLVYATAITLGADRNEVLRVISSLEPVRGRFEHMVSPGGVIAIVDYAHTPDALDNVLETVSAIDGTGKVTVVVGCGGDRDRTKRPEMAEIALTKADLAIFTDDNPRTESPDGIIADMLTGCGSMRNYLVIRDRRQAIRTAIAGSRRGDIVLIAGKGHEDYQIVGTEKTHFSDREEVMRAFSEL